LRQVGPAKRNCSQMFEDGHESGVGLGQLSEVGRNADGGVQTLDVDVLLREQKTNLDFSWI
jgi:hypothetical protein